MEIYEDVLKEEPKFLDKKSHSKFAKWEERSRQSAGWVEPETKGKKVKWDVQFGDGGGFICDRQIEAELLSYLVQINERLKRIEIKLEKEE